MPSPNIGQTAAKFGWRLYISATAVYTREAGALEPAPDLISRVKISPGPGVARPGPAPAARRKNWLARHFLCPHFLPPSAAQSGAGVGILADLPG